MLPEARESIPLQPADGSLFMRPFAIGATAYLLAAHLLHLLTRGSFQLQDKVGDFYLVVLAVYAGAREVKSWKEGDASQVPDTWTEKIRKGGPIITLWVLLFAGAVSWRIHDPTVPMPPELKSITMGVMAVFFGTYALRQYNRRQIRRAAGPRSGAVDEEESRLRQRIAALLAERPRTPKQLSEDLGISRRTLARLLAEMVSDGALVREGEAPNDRTATYRLASN